MKISIRWTLILGFLSLIWGTQIIITSSTFLSSEKVLKHHAGDIMQNIADLTSVQSQNHLALAYGAALLTERLMSSQVVSSSPQYWGLLEKYFLDQLAIYPHFAGIYIGSPNGDFFYVNRDTARAPNGFRTKIISHDNDGRQTCLIWRDERGGFLAEEYDDQDTFDPRKRPWYIRALARDKIVWTDPYVFFSSQKPGITIAGPIYHSSGQLKAIVGVDIEIDQLSLFISKLRIGKHGQAFMFNNNGDVVAFPDLSKLTYKDGPQSGNVRLVKIDELTHGISRAAYHTVEWKKTPDGRYHLETAQFARFDYNGEPYHAMFTPIDDAQWPWIIGVYMPESDYLGGLQANRRFNIWITVVLSVLAALVSIRLARGIIRPLAALEKEALAIKQHDLTQNHDTRSAYKEIQETADSFERMKESLRLSDEKYRAIYENIQDIYYETDMDGQILEVSPSVEKFTRFKRSDLIGTSINPLYKNPDARDAFLQTIIRDGKVDDYELHLSDSMAEGRYCSINATVKYDTAGNPTRIVGSLRIIDDRKKTELELLRYQNQLEELVSERTQDLEISNQQLRFEVEARKGKEEELRKSEEKYRSIITNMDNGYYEMDLEGNLTFFNDPLAEMVGYHRQEMIGLNYRLYIAPDEHPIMERIFGAIRRTRIPEKLSRYTLVCKNGNHKTVEASAALITDVSGKPIGFRGVVLDITERLNAEQEKEKLKERFQQIQRLEGIGTLAGGVAHDFNNLLMGIQGNVSLMLLDIDSLNEHHDKLKNIESCVASGAVLTRQLLGFARGGKYMVKPLDLNQLIERTAGMFGRTRKEIQIIQKMQEEVWTVRADQGQIEQVLLNLCINAWQAMPDGGNIYVETRNVVLDETFVCSFGIEPGRYVKVAVADTGVGMDEATQSRIFEPFFTTKEIGRGTGLGLASAYGIIKNHDGAIDFVSKPGQGTTFYFYLPASGTLLPEVSHQNKKPPPGSGTILLVDDEAMILKVNQAMLEKMGYSVLTASGGQAALNLFEGAKERIDMVILDMIMPDLSGGAVFDRLKAILPDVKVLLSSGYSLSEQSEAILARGCAGFIQKPFNMEQLRAKIVEILGN